MKKRGPERRKESAESGRFNKGRNLARLEQSEREERHTARRVLRSAYLTILGEPPSTKTGDIKLAVSMLAKIKEAWRHRAVYTAAERNRLTKLKGIWIRRAKGLDPQYNLFGTKQGRPKKNPPQWVKEYHTVKNMKEWIEKYDRPNRKQEEYKLQRKLDKDSGINDD